MVINYVCMSCITYTCNFKVLFRCNNSLQRLVCKPFNLYNDKLSRDNGFFNQLFSSYDIFYSPLNYFENLLNPTLY